MRCLGRTGVALLLVAGTVAAGCGSSSSSSSTSSASGGGGSTSTTTSARTGVGETLPPAAQAAESGRAGDFPAPGGRTLQQLANTLTPGPRFAAASSTFTPGTRRISFGLISKSGSPLYGRTVVYVARDASSPASGPYAAPADSLVVSRKYLSKTTEASDTKAVYAARVPFRRPGSYALLTVTRQGGKLVGAAGQVKVAASSPIPGVGDRAPHIHTPTVASVHGDLNKIDTRLPHDDMHKVDLSDVEGKRPAALIISTPALCQSRVCGPVTDVMAQLEPRYRSRMTFIHQEVYNGNQFSGGLRPQLLAFHLRSEPWLFVLDRDGRIAARLEGAFGFRAAEQAIRAGLR